MNEKEIILLEVLVKLAAVNKILIRKGILTEEEVKEEMNAISKELAENMKKLQPELFPETTQN